MKKRLDDIKKDIREWWSAFKPLIADFIIIGLLGFLIYWTRWRK